MLPHRSCDSDKTLLTDCLNLGEGYRHSTIINNIIISYIKNECMFAIYDHAVYLIAIKLPHLIAYTSAKTTGIVKLLEFILNAINLQANNFIRFYDSTFY